MTLRRMRYVDLAFVTDQHGRNFPYNAMSRLGRLFLRRYYWSFFDSPHTVATVAERDGLPCGYLVGILDTGSHRRLLIRRHGVALAGTALIGLALDPPGASRLFLRRMSLLVAKAARRGGSVGETAERGPVAVLSHTAVVGGVRGQGIGQALVQAFVTEARGSGATRISLATQDGPEGAGPFYERQGWQLERRRRTYDGRLISLYDLRL